jgi:hypothetical protein
VTADGQRVGRGEWKIRNLKASNVTATYTLRTGINVEREKKIPDNQHTMWFSNLLLWVTY